MSATAPIEIRDLDPGEVARVHALSQAVGWPHRVDDLRLLLELGHAIAVDGDGDGLAACAAWWPFGDAVATVGLVIVRPDLQGKGIGRALMRRLLDAAGPRRLHLHATEAGRALYEREGFVATGSVKQHQGIVAVAPHPTDRVRFIRADDHARILALDAAALDADRSALLDCLALIGQGLVHEEGERVTGFAFLRPFGRGRVLGPVVAETATAGGALLQAGIALASGTFLRVDTPLADETIRQVLTGAGLSEVDTPLAMVRNGPANPSGPARSFALAAHALG